MFLTSLVPFSLAPSLPLIVAPASCVIPVPSSPCTELLTLPGALPRRCTNADLNSKPLCEIELPRITKFGRYRNDREESRSPGTQRERGIEIDL